MFAVRERYLNKLFFAGNQGVDIVRHLVKATPSRSKLEPSSKWIRSLRCHRQIVAPLLPVLTYPASADDPDKHRKGEGNGNKSDQGDISNRI